MDLEYVVSLVECLLSSIPERSIHSCFLSPWHRQMFWSNTILSFQTACVFPILIDLLPHYIFVCFHHGNLGDFRVSSWPFPYRRNSVLWHLYGEIAKRLNQALVSFTPSILFWATVSSRNNWQWNYFIERSCSAAAPPSIHEPVFNQCRSR